MDGSNFPPLAWSDRETDTVHPLVWRSALVTALFLGALVVVSVGLASVMPSFDPLLPPSWADVD